MSTLYFLACTADKTLLCKDGTWAKKQSVLADPDRVLTFPEAESASRILMGLPNRKNTYICNERTLYKKYGISNAALLFGKGGCGPLPDNVTPLEADKPEAPNDNPPNRITLQTNQRVVVNTPLILDTIDILERLQVLLERWDETIVDYPSELSELDGRIQDELHYQEFSQLNCAQGYRAYKRMHELRISRRRAKNEYLVSKTARDLFRIDLDAKIKTALTAIQGLKELSYVPRAFWPGDKSE